MKVKLLTGMTSEHFAYSPGDVVDLPSKVAKRMIQRGTAEPVEKKAEKATRTGKSRAVTKPQR